MLHPSARLLRTSTLPDGMVRMPACGWNWAPINPALLCTYALVESQKVEVRLSLGCDAGNSINDLLTMKSGVVPCKAVRRLTLNGALAKNATEAVPAGRIALVKYARVGKMYTVTWVSTGQELKKGAKLDLGDEPRPAATKLQPAA